jgi:two-component system CheB/CheR fusion protein
MQALPEGEPASVDSKAVTDSARRALKILLVDDHHDTCAALEKLLARRGHLVAVSHDVRSAMEAAVGNKFDLLISDIALPDGTGMDLMMQLRAIANVPGIAISGFGNNGDIERSLQAASRSISSNPSSSTTLKPPSNGHSARRDASVAASIAAWSSQ